jgi:hypothetical protein
MVMRVLFFLVILPFIGNAQFERSAKQLAQENIQDYISTKLFRNRVYEPLSFGEIKTPAEKNREIACYIEHKFLVVEPGYEGDEHVTSRHLYTALFYFDSRMRIVRVESSYTNANVDPVREKDSLPVDSLGQAGVIPK